MAPGSDHRERRRRTPETRRGSRSGEGKSGPTMRGRTWRSVATLGRAQERRLEARGRDGGGRFPGRPRRLPARAGTRTRSCRRCRGWLARWPRSAAAQAVTRARPGWGEHGRVKCLPSSRASAGPRADDLVNPNLLLPPAEGHLPEIGELEAVPGELKRPLAHDDRARAGHGGRDAGGDVDRIADHRELPAPGGPDGTGHDAPAVDPDPQRDRVLAA